MRIDFFQRNACFFAFGANQTKLNLFRNIGKERKVGASAVVGRSERVRLTRPYLIFADCIAWFM